MQAVLADLGLDAERTHSGVGTGSFFEEPGGETIASLDPATGEVISRVRLGSLADYERVLEQAAQAFPEWRRRPDPVRGELLRRMAEVFRARRDALAWLVSREMGKILPEARAELEEVIDQFDQGPGLAAQVRCAPLPPDRTGLGRVEQWHPLGVVGVLTPFPQPLAAWARIAAPALALGNVVVWKPSHSTPLTAVAAQKIVAEVLAGEAPEGVHSLVSGRSKDVGEALLADRRVPLIAATGSCRMGRRVAEVAGGRLARTLLGLGGNNAAIVLADADQALALEEARAGVLATAGQGAGAMRRLILERGIAEEFTARLVDAFGRIRIGNPLEPGIELGPLVDELALEQMLEAVGQAEAQGGVLLCGGRRLPGAPFEGGCFVEPALIRAHPGLEIARGETLAPILYLFEAGSLEEALRIQNAVDQGLCSALFTRDLAAAELFLSAAGSDCGLANVNAGTARIGAAFLGAKESGAGAEAGCGPWRAFLRRRIVGFSPEGPRLPLTP